jgi:hypothetical protein
VEIRVRNLPRNERNQWIDKGTATEGSTALCIGSLAAPVGSGRVGSGRVGSARCWASRGKLREPASVRPASTHGTAVPPAFGSFVHQTKRRPRSEPLSKGRKRASEHVQRTHAYAGGHSCLDADSAAAAGKRPPRHPRPADRPIDGPGPTEHALEADYDYVVLEDELPRRVSADGCCYSLLSSLRIRSDSFFDPFVLASGVSIVDDDGTEKSFGSALGLLTKKFVQHHPGTWACA